MEKFWKGYKGFRGGLEHKSLEASLEELPKAVFNRAIKCQGQIGEEKDGFRKSVKHEIEVHFLKSTLGSRIS